MDECIRLELNSKDIAAEKLEQLRVLFPEVFSEGRVDFARLKEAIGIDSRKVRIRFGSDPDVTFIEEIGKTSRKILSIEIKGGKDASNLYNRLGEAEKSHLKARGAGFVEFWTIVNASNFDFEKAKAQTPTTRQFFMLSCLMDQETEDFKRFRDLLSSCINI
jgi:hypothetical protein